MPAGVLLHLDECPKILDISNNAQQINTEAFIGALGRGVRKNSEVKRARARVVLRMGDLLGSLAKIKNPTLSEDRSG